MERKRSEVLAEIEHQTGYTFTDINLLDVALTHTSYVKGEGKGTEHNERMEFLGDAVLELIVSDYLYRTYPEMDEGNMTRMRAQAVYEHALYEAAISFNLGKALRMSHGEERTGGRMKPSILSDALEAVIGAIYLDGGFEPASRFALDFAKKFIDSAVQGATSKDYKTLLQEYAQKEHLGAIQYNVFDEKGPDHKKIFGINVFIGDTLMGHGYGSTKQEAGQIAAREALSKYNI